MSNGNQVKLMGPAGQIQKITRRQDGAPRVRSFRKYWPLAVMTILCVLSPDQFAYASDVRDWGNKIVSTLTPLGLGIGTAGFLVVGIAHSSVWGHDWARKHEGAVMKGAVFTFGSTGLVNLFHSIFS